MLLDYQKPLKQELKKKYAEIDQLFNEGKIVGWRYLTMRNEAKRWYQRETATSTARIYNLLPKKKKEDIEMQVAKEVYRKYSTITDMYSSLGKGRLHPEYGGYHDKDYWKREDNKRVKEFFAEAFSGYTLEDEHYKELINAFPKSIEIFEEIYNQIN